MQELQKWGNLVSVSLRSIIHSYEGYELDDIKYSTSCFRLLTEYHSFLCSEPMWISDMYATNSFRLLTEYHSFLLFQEENPLANRKMLSGFRLLTEYHSFLLIRKNQMVIDTLGLQFPSPYGVSFILMYTMFAIIRTAIVSFRLLTEYHSFL